jgi:hypothetical protein
MHSQAERELAEPNANKGCGHRRACAKQKQTRSNVTPPQEACVGKWPARKSKFQTTLPMPCKTQPAQSSLAPAAAPVAPSAFFVASNTIFPKSKPGKRRPSGNPFHASTGPGKLASPKVRFTLPPCKTNKTHTAFHTAALRLSARSEQRSKAKAGKAHRKGRHPARGLHSARSLALDRCRKTNKTLK